MRVMARSFRDTWLVRMVVGVRRGVAGRGDGSGGRWFFARGRRGLRSRPRGRGRRRSVELGRLGGAREGERGGGGIQGGGDPVEVAGAHLGLVAMGGEAV